MDYTWQDLDQDRDEVTRDRLFLINTVLDDGSSPITLIQNWNPMGK